MHRSSKAKSLSIAAICGLLGLIFLYWYGTPLPKKESVYNEILRGSPTQIDATNTSPFKAHMGGTEYTFTPHGSYTLPGLVVSLHHSDSFTDISHEGDPAQTVDICVVWGPNIATNGYRMVTYDHGDWTCYYRWTTEYDPPFSGNFLSNNHLIPRTPELAKRIKDIKVGDQIILSGELVDYAISTNSGALGSRNTSLVRTDSGNGACEILLLNDVIILKQHMPWREPLWGILLTMMVLGCIGGFYFSMPQIGAGRSVPKIETPPDVHNPFDARNFIKRDEEKPTDK